MSAKIEQKKSLHTTLEGRKDVTDTPEGGAIITDVLILQEGEDKCGDYFDLEFLNDYIRIANAKATGVKCRLGHPDWWGGKDPITTFLGNIKNHRLSKNEAGKATVIADVYVSPVAKVSPDGDNFTFIVEMAKNHPEDFGLSIHYYFQFKEIKAVGEDGSEGVILGQSLADIIACDFVDRPAVNESLYKSVDQDDSLIEQIFQISKNKGMEFLEKIKNKLGIKTKSLELSDANGKKLVVETDAQDPAVDDSVTIDGAAAPDGDYVIAGGSMEGSTLKIAAGKITEIVAKAADPAAASEGEDAATKSINEMQKKFDDLEKKLTAKFKKQIDELQKSIELVADNVASEFVPDEKENEGSGKLGKKKNDENVRIGLKAPSAKK